MCYCQLNSNHRTRVLLQFVVVVVFSHVRVRSFYRHDDDLRWVAYQNLINFYWHTLKITSSFRWNIMKWYSLSL